MAVLGAGVTGLTAAFRLVQAGCRVRLFEASDRVGGAIRTERTADGWLVEGGPNSLLSGSPPLAALIPEIGLDAARVEANPAARHRYIVRAGRPVAAPLSPPALMTSPLFSFGAKLRLLADLLARPRVRSSDVSLAQFAASHFGAEFVAYGINPFVAGVYAGNPDKLSARYAFPQLWAYEQKYGSILRGQRATAKAAAKSGPARDQPRIFSFERGLAELPTALARSLPEGALSVNARLEALVPGKPWSIVWRDATNETHTEQFDAIVAALPAPALAQLRLGTLGERPLAGLEGIEHPPVSSLFLGYRQEQVRHPLDGFGLLVPEVERRAILGVLFSSSLFPGRAPAGHVGLTVMVGGTRQPELARLAPERLRNAIESDLAELLGVSGPPVFQRHTFWPRAIPQYNLGYERFLDAMAETERSHPGFFIGGQARDGIAVPACVAAGEKLARRVLDEG